MGIEFGSRISAVQERKVDQVLHLNEKIQAAFMEVLGSERHDPSIVIYCASQLLCACVRAAIPDAQKADFDALAEAHSSEIQAAHQVMLLAGRMSPLNVLARLYGSSEQESVALMSIATLKESAGVL